MPCDQIIQNRVEFAAGTDMDLMRGALEDAGYRVWDFANGVKFARTQRLRLGGTFANGLFTVNEDTDTDAIKRAYSARSVRATARKFGWAVKVDAKNPLKLQIVKRS